MKNFAISTMLISIVFTTSAFSSVTDILIYSPETNHNEEDTLNGIEDLTATLTNDLSDITFESLSNYDVLYTGTSYWNTLDSKAGIIQNYLSSGGGVVVGQSNVTGPIDWLPNGLEASVQSIFYPKFGNCVLTGSGLSHPIFDGLTTADLGVAPADTIYSYDLGPSWDVLMVHSSDSDMVGMAAGAYGSGRLLLWPEFFGPGSINDIPSDDCIRQAFEWVAVPEPATILLLGLGGLVLRKKRGETGPATDLSFSAAII